MAKVKIEGKDERQLLLDAWKAIVDVQMHFNDVLMRVRNLGITLILAVFGAAAFSLQYELFLRTPWRTVHVAVAIILFGLVAWACIGFMDRYYNKLLAGAVAKTTALEDLYDEAWLGMTHEITAASRTLFGWRNVKARRQMLWFLYLPIVMMGLSYMALIIWAFQPAYTRSTDKRADEEKRGEVISAPRVPKVEQAPAATKPAAPPPPSSPEPAKAPK